MTKRFIIFTSIFLLFFVLLLALPLTGYGGGTVNADTALAPEGGNKEIKIATGPGYSLALKSDGTVWAWGENTCGQLGDGTDIIKTTPVQVSNLDDIIAITAGGAHSLALKSGGTVLAWGANWNGQLGDGTDDSKKTPVQVSNLSDIVAIAGGGEHSFVLKSDGTVWAWGRNSFGSLGNGQGGDKTFDYDENIPVPVINLTDAVAIAAGGWHSLALKSDGTVWTWGCNNAGQLGDGTNNNKNIPGQVSNLGGVIAIAAGGTHSVALKSDGSVWCWGRNDDGQLGDGTNINRSIPVQVLNLTGVVAVAAGSCHSFALKSDGTVWAWGFNECGQLGDGTVEDFCNKRDKKIPVQVKDENGVGYLTGVIAIAGGYDHSLALKADGTVWAWGNNDWGKLGDGTNISKNTPVRVKGF